MYMCGGVHEQGTRAPALEGLTASFTAGATSSTALTPEEERQVMELREQVLRVWALLTSSKGFDPAVLRPLLQLAQVRVARCPLSLGTFPSAHTIPTSLP